MQLAGRRPGSRRLVRRTCRLRTVVLGAAIVSAVVLLGACGATQTPHHSGSRRQSAGSRAGAASDGRVSAELHREESFARSLHRRQARSSKGEDATPLLSADAQASFGQLEAGLPGPVGVAVMPLGAGSPVVLGDDAAVPGWSTTKVPVLVALIKARLAQGSPLTAGERSLASSAIQESDNQAILDLFADLTTAEGSSAAASEYMDGLLRKSGDRETQIATRPPPPGAVTPFGQTLWRPREAVKFFAALGNDCLIPRSSTDYVLGLMEHITPSESWGLGQAGFPGIAFKGGWGPSPTGEYLVRQSGIVDPGSSSAIAVAIQAFPAGTGEASFAEGVTMVNRVATWLRAQLAPSARPARGCPAPLG